MWRRVWASLGDSGRERFLDDVCGSDRDARSPILVYAIAKRLNFRQATIAKEPSREFRSHVSRVMPGLSPRSVAELLRSMHLDVRRSRMNALHDAMGWPSLDDRGEGEVSSGEAGDPWTTVRDATREALEAARTKIEGLRADEWLLILATLADAGHPKVLAAAREALEAEVSRSEAASPPIDDAAHGNPRAVLRSEAPPRSLEAPLPTGPDGIATKAGDDDQASDLESSVADPPEHEDSLRVPGEPAAPEIPDIYAFLPRVSEMIGIPGERHGEVVVEGAFGAVDRLVTGKLVELLLTSVEDAVAVGPANRLVEALIEVNPARPVSRFHAGFFAAIAERPFRPDGPGWNMERRSWYAHGWAMGIERTRGTDAAIAEFDRWRDENLPFLRPVRRGEVVEEPRQLIAEQLMRLAIERERGDLVRVAVETRGLASPQALDRLFQWLLRSRHAEQAEHRLVAARAASEFVTSRAAVLPPEVQCIAAAAVARAMREAGRFEETPPRPPNLEDVDEAARRVVDAEALLLRLRIGSLETLSSRSLGQWRDLAGRVEAHREDFERPWGRHGGAVISLIAALRVLHSPIDWKIDSPRAEADRRLAFAIEAWSLAEPGTPEHRLLELATWWRQGLRGAHPDAEGADEALTTFEREAEIGGWLPRAIHTECIVNARLAGRTVAEARLVEAFLAAHGVEALYSDDLLGEGALPPFAIEQIRASLDDLDRRGTIGLPVQWALADAVLATAMSPEGADHGHAEWAVDQLERLGHAPEPEVRRRWLAFLKDDERASRCFEDAEEYERALLTALDHAEEFEAATQHVLARLEAAWQRGDYDAVEDLIAWLDERHATHTVRPEMRSDRPMEAPDGHAIRPSPCSVLFIGGNETQKRYEADLRAGFEKRDPELAIVFEPLGWTSNWGREIDRLKASIHRADAIVLMTFLRTQCGRTLRRLAGEAEKPWIPCTGHGRASLEAAIRRAAQVARRRPA